MLGLPPKQYCIFGDPRSSENVASIFETQRLEHDDHQLRRNAPARNEQIVHILHIHRVACASHGPAGPMCGGNAVVVFGGDMIWSTKIRTFGPACPLTKPGALVLVESPYAFVLGAPRVHVRRSKMQRRIAAR